MQLSHQYYYRKGLATTKAVIYSIMSVLLVTFAVYCYVHWELSFMFTDWHGYVIIIPYFLITLGIILSIFENIKKASKTNNGIPAFAVNEDCFVLYDKTGMKNVIPFDDCDKVKFKSTYSRICGTQLKLIVKYHSKMEPMDTSSFEIDLNELDQPQSEIDKQLKKIYHQYNNNKEQEKT